MNRIGVTQRVVIERSERRDSLDQRWYPFLQACGFTPVLLPNHLETAMGLMNDISLRAVLLTGGNDLVAYGGDAPERDALEFHLVDRSIEKKIPLIGVCRGMQIIQHVLGAKFEKVTGHVTPQLPIQAHGKKRTVNSYHGWGTRQNVAALETWAIAEDGIIKAVRHCSAPVMGVMWHPERNLPFDAEDLVLFRKLISNSKESQVA
jgi:N5-(cytidine 5'-diphosphoramidyl)-L-glutamine hydrolase